MVISVNPTDPQFVFGGPAQALTKDAFGNQIIIDFVEGSYLSVALNQIIKGSFAFSIIHLAPSGYLENDWTEIWTLPQVATQADIDAAGGPQAYMISQAQSVYSQCDSGFTSGWPPHNWMVPFVPPTPFDPVAGIIGLAKLYGDVSPTKDSPDYEDIVALRDPMILSATYPQVQNMIAAIPGWQSQAGNTATQLLAWLRSID